MLRNLFSVHIVFLLLVFSIPVTHVVAADAAVQSLSVTPPLFQLSVDPGDNWQSSIKVINVNAYDLTVYAEVVNFEPEGEQGRGRFIPSFGEEDDHTLASWITISNGPYHVPAEQSKEINFVVDVPKDAAPGGHFAAILISTEPPSQGDEAYVLRTSQTVTSLFFVRIEGDIVESATIREFTMKDSFVDEPNAEFFLRFENKGNVHLQPRGSIVITNMWGKERGVVPVNYRTRFGNVLPESIREFTFAWKGEGSITEIGRYKAVATLAYGEAGVKSVSATTYFWVIPIKATLITVAAIIAFILFVTWAIKLYVRRMLSLAGINVEAVRQKNTMVQEVTEQEVETKRRIRAREVAAPLAIGARDLSTRLKGVHTLIDVIKTFTGFVVHYKVFFGSVFVIIVGFVGITLYIAEGTKADRPYAITIPSPEGDTIVDSEEIIKDEIREDIISPIVHSQPFTLTVINASGVVGSAAEMSVVLEDAGFFVDTTTTLEEGTVTDSTIRYSKGLEDTVSKLWEYVGDIESIEILHEEGEDLFIEITIGATYDATHSPTHGDEEGENSL